MLIYGKPREGLGCEEAGVAQKQKERSQTVTAQRKCVLGNEIIPEGRKKGTDVMRENRSVDSRSEEGVRRYVAYFSVHDKLLWKKEFVWAFGVTGLCPSQPGGMQQAADMTTKAES